MLYIQAGVTTVVVVASLLGVFIAVAKFAASKTYVVFNGASASGAFCTWIAIACMMPGFLVLLVLYRQHGWQLSHWVVPGIIFLMLAIILIAIRHGVKRSPQYPR